MWLYIHFRYKTWKIVIKDLDSFEEKNNKNTRHLRKIKKEKEKMNIVLLIINVSLLVAVLF